ncbi:glycosyltransferase family 4 protein [Streptomyces violascens]|uniref:glycosyltransferase family 4 protein n=1 Tax=Streptomyces violascens TaxID=67381 RepID=UPI003690EC33
MVIQPYVSAYRLPFFQRLEGELTSRDIRLSVAHGTPWGKDAWRADARQLPGAIELPQFTWELAGRHFVYRKLGALATRCDALILSQALHTLDSYLPVLRPSGPPVGLWGHGGTYNRSHSAPLRTMKRLFTNRARWFFAYTELGARQVISQGFPAQRVTVVRNTIDTTRLAADREGVADDQLTALRRRLGLRRGRTALYIGGLDASKRIPFLLAAAESAARALPGFRLVIAGDGSQRRLVEEAVRRGETVRYAGRVADEDKALLGAAADVMMVPGAVGLVAVDSLALGVPLVTTSDAPHGPEFEYLEDGRNALIVDGSDLDGYVAAVVGLLGAPERLTALRTGCRSGTQEYSAEGMARRFADGVEGLLQPLRGEPR